MIYINYYLNVNLFSYWAAKFISEAGGKIIGVAEWDGSVYDANGIDVEDLNEYKKTNKGIKGYTKGQFFEDE